MSNLTLPINGINLEIINVEDLNGKKRIIIGDCESELIFKSLSSLKVQVGTKYIDINSDQITKTNNSSIITLATYDNVMAHGSEYISDLEENQLIYDTFDSSLYIVRGGMFIKPNSSTGNNISGGGNVENTIVNTISRDFIVQSMSDLTSLKYDKIFKGLLVYVINDQSHYVLISDDYKNINNWKLAYVSRSKGGNINGPLILTATNKVDARAVFNINGYYNLDDIKKTKETENIFSIGQSGNSLLALWMQESGKAILQIDSYNKNSAFILKTISNHNLIDLINIEGNKISLADSINIDYDLAINLNTLFKQPVVFQKSLQSLDFSKGINGYGFSIYKNPIDQLWTLEIDKVENRQKTNDKQIITNYTNGINGSKLFNNSYSIEVITSINQYDHYIKKEFVGNYINNNNIYEQINYEDYCFIPVNNTISSVLSLFNIDDKYLIYPFQHGSHKLNIISNKATFLEQPNSYIFENNIYTTATGTHNYDTINNTYIETINGTHVLANTLYFYDINFNENHDIVTGDMFVIQKFNEFKIQEKFIYLYCIKSQQNNNLFVSNSSDITINDILFRIGNCYKTYTCNYTDGITTSVELFNSKATLTHVNDIEIIYPNCYNNSNIIESDNLLNGKLVMYQNLKSFNDFKFIDNEMIIDFNQYHYNVDRKGIEINEDKINFKIGRIGNIIDKDLLINQQDRNKETIYIRDGYFKGNAVINNGKFGELINSKGILFVNVLKKNLSEYTIQETANSFNSSNMPFFLDTVNFKLSIGSNLSFENSTLKLSNLKDISIDFKTLVDVTLPTIYSTIAYVNKSISDLIDTAPTTLDTLNELAAALGDDPNFATTITNLIGTKEPIITKGTINQYWRGDKAWITLDKYAVGLVNIDEYVLTGFNGIIKTFTITNNYTNMKIYLNGIRLFVGEDYIETDDKHITFIEAPLNGDRIIFDYIKK